MHKLMPIGSRSRSRTEIFQRAEKYFPLTHVHIASVIRLALQAHPNQWPNKILIPDIPKCSYMFLARIIINYWSHII